MGGQTEGLTITEASQRLDISSCGVQRCLDAGELETGTAARQRYVKLTAVSANGTSNSKVGEGLHDRPHDIGAPPCIDETVASVSEGDIIDATPYDMLSIAEAAKRLGVSVRAVQRRLRQGKLEGIATDGQRWVLLPVAAGDGMHDAAMYDDGKDHAVVMAGHVENSIARDTTDTLQRRQRHPDDYTTHDVALVISRAIAEAITVAQTPLLARIEELTAAHISLTERLELQVATQALRMEEIKQLRKDRTALVAAQAATAAAQAAASAAQDAQTAEIAALRAEVLQLRQMPENPLKATQAAVEEAMGKSLVPFLRNMRVVTAAAETLKAENNLLKFELEDARRPWWKFWQRQGKAE